MYAVRCSRAKVSRSPGAGGLTPGASIAVGRYGRLVLLKGYGTLDYSQGSPAVEPSTIYDLASLTKVLSTTPLVMQQVEHSCSPVSMHERG